MYMKAEITYTLLKKSVARKRKEKQINKLWDKEPLHKKKTKRIRN